MALVGAVDVKLTVWGVSRAVIEPTTSGAISGGWTVETTVAGVVLVG